jgi:hypothetical protein
VSDKEDDMQGREKPFRVRLPGFTREEDIGLGSVLKYASNRAGIKPCGGCERRAHTLNRWVVFGGRNS